MTVRMRNPSCCLCTLAMKKKKSKRKSTASGEVMAATGGGAGGMDELQFLIKQHSLFFDNLVNLIPAKFYLESPDADDKPWFKGLSKAAKASAKKQTRENLKKARRDRLDPDKSLNTTIDILKQSIDGQKSKNLKKLEPKTADNGEEEEEEEDGGGDDNVKTIAGFGGVDEDKSVTYEELRQKLHRKMELLRGNRGQGKRSQSEKTEKRDNQDRKRKRSENDQIGKKSNGKDDKIGKNEVEIEKDVEDATKGIEFGKVRINSGEDGGMKKKKNKRKLSKEKELETVKRLEEVRKEDPKVAKKHSWKAATSRAMGVKVHDDPKLLEKSIKKEKKRHDKNVEKWKERVESREKVKEEKQQKRAGNIAEKIKEKKERKIAKREKKLMRPGFEGRKEGYITTD